MPDAVTHAGATSREEFARTLLAFINGPLSARHRKSSQTSQVDASTPLFQRGIIDSLGILDLLAFVENATGRTIPTRKVDMQCFGTVDSICRSFWPDDEGAQP
jgi:acyl carrier protein